MCTAAAVQFRQKLAVYSIGGFLITLTSSLKRVLKGFLSVYQCCGSGIQNRFFSGSQISDPGSRISDPGSRIPRPYF
jgi:hypothetical protein